jgi:hypothetical protein
MISDPIPRALQTIFVNMQVKNKSVNPSELLKSFGWDASDLIVQQDIQEVLLLLLVCLISSRNLLALTKVP